MTKKDFEAIAAILKSIPLVPNSYGRERVINHFCIELKKSNPKFNKDLFIKACWE